VLLESSNFLLSSDIFKVRKDSEIGQRFAFVIVDINRFYKGLIFPSTVDYGDKVYRDNMGSALLDSRIEYRPRIYCF
jgi:hypothetical protein